MSSDEDIDKEIEALVVEHGKELDRYLRGRLRLPDRMAGEVINDALLAITVKRRDGHTFENMRAYLFTVAKRGAIRRLTTRYLHQIPVAASRDGDRRDRRDRRDRLQDIGWNLGLYDAISELSPLQQDVIVLHLCEYGTDEAASILGVPPSEIGSATTAGLQRLEQILAEQDAAGAGGTA